MEKKLEMLEKILQNYNKPKLIAVIVDVAKDGKRNFNRIVSSLFEGYDDLKA